MVNDEVTIFYDRVGAAFIQRFDPAVAGDDPEAAELNEEELFDDDRYVALPSAFDIHEWRILRDFCMSQPEGAIRDELLGAVHGRGAFRWTKTVIWERGLRDAWFAYRNEALTEIARHWAEEHAIELAAEERET